MGPSLQASEVNDPQTVKVHPREDSVSTVNREMVDGGGIEPGR